MRFTDPGLGHVLTNLKRHLCALELLQGPQGAYGVLGVRRRGAHGAYGHDEGVRAGKGVGEHAREEALPVRGLLALGRPHDAEALLERKDRGVDLCSILAALRVVVRAVLPALAARAIHERQHGQGRTTPAWGAAGGEVDPVDGVRPRGGIVDLRGSRCAVGLCTLHERHQILCRGDAGELQVQNLCPVVLVLHHLQLLLHARRVQQVAHRPARNLEGGQSYGQLSIPSPTAHGFEELHRRSVQQACHSVCLATPSLAEHEERRNTALLHMPHSRSRALGVHVVVGGGLAKGVREAEAHMGDEERPQVSLGQAIVHNELRLAAHGDHIELISLSLVAEERPLPHADAHP
mmetsp:Transcript_42936/g.134108  ORF Transcript_42936/g.134108 Transcript_42936/m.134108 type:complete len:349 (-) Transcript_42936:1250-2296(-)